MNRFILALAATLATVSLGFAQTYRDSSGTVVPGFAPLLGCTIGGNCAGPVSSSNPLPVSGSFSASLSGFAPGSAYATPLSVSTTSARVALPTGSTVVVYNTGSAAAYVQLGGSSVTATAANDVIAAGGWLALTVNSNTYLAAITASGSTTLNLSGGSGLATGIGGGGGGASVPTGSAGSPNASVLSVQGVSGGTAVPVVIGAGANIIGSVNAAQAGTWNIGAITGTVSLPTGAATAANQTNVESAPGTAQTTAVTIQGNASGISVPVSGTLAATQSGTWNVGGLGAAGTPSGGVVSVQGVSGGTTIPVTIGAGANIIGSVNAAQAGTWNIGAITGTVSLPTGAATAAAQTAVESAPGTPQTTAITIQGNASGVAVPVSGTITAASSNAITNPPSTLTLPAATTAYAAGNLIANNATAGSITVPSFSILNSAGGAMIPRVRLSTNDATSTGWGGVQIQIDLWTAAPTFTNGDRGAWALATGSGSHFATYTCTMSAVWGDGAYNECAPSAGSAATGKLASGTAVYWTLKAVTASGVTGASKVFTLVPELLN